MKRLSRIASILTALSLILVACSQPAQIVTTQVAVTQIVTTQVVTTQIVTTQVVANTAETPATEPAPAKTSLVFAVSGGASAAEGLLDPTMDTGAGARFSAVNNIYDPLVLWDVASGQFVPRLALSWEQVQTDTVRFTLRPDVTFQNGSAFTADDVAFTFNQTLDPSTGGTSRTLFSALQRAEVVDPLTVDLIGQPATILYLADTMLIVDKETYEDIGAAEYNLHPVGTGPYTVAAWEPGHSITLQAYPGYWDGPAAIETVTIRYVAEAATKVAMLYAGEADVIDLVPPDLIDQIDSQPDFEIRTAPSPRAAFVTINTFQEPFDDVRVRQAIAYAIDWQGIVDGLYAGKGKLLTDISASILPLGDPDIQPYPYDPEMAKQLLTEAGFPDGFDTTFNSPAGWFYLDREASQAIVNDLAAVGIRATFSAADRGSFFRQWVNKGTALAYFSCGSTNMSPIDCQRLHFHSQVRGIYYNDPALDQIIDAYGAASDPAEQQTKMNEVHQWVHDNVPYVPGYEADQVFAVRTGLVWQPNGDERIYLHDASWATP